MNQSQKYSLFGLNILSELPIPELHFSGFNYPDVSIILGNNPDYLQNVKKNGVLYQACNNDFLFKVRNVASFRVQNANLITIQPSENSSPEEIRLFLLGSVFGALLQQRDSFPLHASTVAKDNQAYVLAGVSGAGKSSLAAALCKRGFTLISDDVSLITFNGNEARVHQGIPQFKLWQDVIKYFGMDQNAFFHVRTGISKYKKPANHHFSEKPVMVRKISILKTKNTGGFELHQLKGSEKFNLLKNNTFRRQYIEGLDKNEQHFSFLSKLASQVETYQLTRPVTPLQIHELADFFERNIFIQTGKTEI